MRFLDNKLRLMNRFYSNSIWNRYIKLCSKHMDSAYFILSFDCDTNEDISVAQKVHDKLLDMDINPVYAVPGSLLRRGANVYKYIFQTGAEFINHGGREHTFFNLEKKRHESCFFYDKQSKEDIYTDIIEGHNTLQDVLGMKPQGWRTPHFGTFQKPSDLTYLYRILNELDYIYSSSTCPIFAYRYGSSFNTDNIIEIPVTGIFYEPFNIMDTWAFFAAPDRNKSSLDYLNNTKELCEYFKNKPILINIYGDPSHIHDKPEFFDAMKILQRHAKNINYSQYLEVVYDTIRVI